MQATVSEKKDLSLHSVLKEGLESPEEMMVRIDDFGDTYLGVSVFIGYITYNFHVSPYWKQVLTDIAHNVLRLNNEPPALKPHYLAITMYWLNELNELEKVNQP